MKGDCVIVDFVRTPLCAIGGALRSRTVAELAQAPMQALMDRNKLLPAQLDHVICGHAHMDTDPYNLARTAWLLTRLDENTPGYTVHACGASGILALQKAYYLFRTGNDLTALVGGAESYTNAPYILRDARYRVDLERFPVVDSIREGEQWTQPEPLEPRELAKALALEKGYAPESLEAAFERERDGADISLWDGRLIPVSWPDRKKGVVSVTEDAPPELKDGFPGYCDGAAMLLAAEEERAKELGLKPVAKVLGFASAACAPENRWEGAVKAAKRLLERHPDVSPAQIAEIELIADSAASTLASAEGLAKLGLDAARVNRAGGCLSNGVNESADGVIAVGRCILNLKQSQGRYGLIAADISGGQGMAMLLELL